MVGLGDKRMWGNFSCALLFITALGTASLAALTCSLGDESACIITLTTNNAKRLFRSDLSEPYERQIPSSAYPLTLTVTGVLEGTTVQYRLFDSLKALQSDPTPLPQKLLIAHESALITITPEQITLTYPETPPIQWLARLSNLPLSQEAWVTVHRLFKKLTHEESPSLIEYLELIARIPWGKRAMTAHQPSEIRKLLDREHWGLDEVKENIVLYLSSLPDPTLSTAPKNRSTILCLVGPPGVGKTTVAASVAHALNRPLFALALNGESDSSLIKGHQRTYKDAAPGAIVEALCSTGVLNPVIVLDEIDKVAVNAEGSRLANALLDVLDPAQNKQFKDHYLGLPLDVSEALFIATANDITKIPKPLLDRCEIIEVAPYTVRQKIKIAQQFLVPKALTELSLDPTLQLFSPELLREIVCHYSSGSGLRDLEKNLRKLCRYYHKALKEAPSDVLMFSSTHLKQYLTPRQNQRPSQLVPAIIGLTYAMVMTDHGADISEISATNIGKGPARLCFANDCSSQFHAATTLVPALINLRKPHHQHCIARHYSNETFYQNSVCLHLSQVSSLVAHEAPSLALPLCIATLSALTGHGITTSYALCGELDGYERVLPVQHIKQRVVAAEHAGFKSLIVPLANKPELLPLIPYLDDLSLVFVSSLNEVLTFMGPSCQLKKR